jgi:hypothetical protein
MWLWYTPMQLDQWWLPENLPQALYLDKRSVSSVCHVHITCSIKQMQLHGIYEPITLNMCINYFIILVTLQYDPVDHQYAECQ